MDHNASKDFDITPNYKKIHYCNKGWDFTGIKCSKFIKLTLPNHITNIYVGLNELNYACIKNGGENIIGNFSINSNPTSENVKVFLKQGIYQIVGTPHRIEINNGTEPINATENDYKVHIIFVGKSIHNERSESEEKLTNIICTL